MNAVKCKYIQDIQWCYGCGDADEELIKPCRQLYDEELEDYEGQVYDELDEKYRICDWTDEYVDPYQKWERKR